MTKITVGVLGATGAIGQRIVQLLENHPWFDVVSLCASEKSAGKLYKDALAFRISSRIPTYAANLKLKLCEPKLDAKVVFSALDSSVAGEIEDMFADNGYIVVSNSKNHRMDTDVPLIIPEINADHLSLIDVQKKRRSGKGFIVSNPNCTAVGLTMVLKPLHDAFGVKSVLITSMQALSGAGYPGVASLDAVDNLVPFIEGEEEKVETEPLKILGRISHGLITRAEIKISANCNRVPVRDGHTECVELSFKKPPTTGKAIKTLEEFAGSAQRLKLPLAPKKPIVYIREDDRPQPILDRDISGGMSVIVGRVRKSNVMDLKLSLLVHNTIRGAAGAAILNGELLKAKNFLL